MKDKPTYQPSIEDYEKAKEFAIVSAKNHRSNGRNENEIISNIIIGKLGEIAYKNWMGSSVNDPKLEPTIEPDDGWDFVKSDGTRVQVKVIGENAKWVSFTNWYWDELVVIRYRQNYLQLEHIKSKSQIHGISKKSSFKGFYYEA
jgi:hypothetical protein